jgi:hypothetical protein
VVNGSLTHCTASGFSQSEISTWRQQSVPAPRHPLSFSLFLHHHHHPLLTAVLTPQPWTQRRQLSYSSPHPLLARDERMAYQPCRMRATAVLWTLKLPTLRQALAISHLRRLPVVSVRQQSGRRERRRRLSPRRLNRRCLRLTQGMQLLSLTARLLLLQQRRLTQAPAAAATTSITRATATTHCAASALQALTCWAASVKGSVGKAAAV